MRLTCPNCEAQYEVDEAVIPEGGRDVQCSNCGHTWYQTSSVALNAGDQDPAAGDADDDLWDDALDEDRVPPPEPPAPPPAVADAAAEPQAPTPEEAAKPLRKPAGVDLGVGERS